MFGSDFLTYCYDKDHGTGVEDTVTSSILEYCHDHWESQYGVQSSPEPQEDLSGKCHPRAPDLHVGTDMLDKPASRHNPVTQPNKCDNSVESVTCHSSPQLKATVVVEDQYETTQSQPTALHLAMAKATTRGEEAALHSLIPRLASRSPMTLRPVYGKPSSCDPFSITERPCESDIEKSQKILNNAQKAGKNPTGIDIVGKGQFSESALCTLKRFCTLAHTSHKVSAEANWLSQMRCSSGDLMRLQDALWHHPTNRPILKYGKKGLDATSFSDLVEERYINNFVIDICISKFLDEARENGKNDTVYFPTEFPD